MSAIFTTLTSYLENKQKKNKIIFTFWEPRKKIPGYLGLCIKTWKKFLFDYEIRILDYENIKEYLGEKLFSKIISKDMSLQLQSDAIRVAILNKYGGIWMDADTIIINREFLKDLKKSELVMIGDTMKGTQHIGFISASHKSHIINKWLEKIIDKVKIFKQIKLNKTNNLKSIGWNYLGNQIIDVLLKNSTIKQFLRLDRDEMKALPELFFENNTLDHITKYNQFWFKKEKKKIPQILNQLKGIILLHNSWTPIKYKIMQEKEFLKKDILLSRFLKYILN